MKMYAIFTVLLAVFVGVSTWYFFTPNDTAAAGIYTITGNTAAAENQIGWLFNRVPETSTSYSFVPGVGNLGNGALGAGPITTTNFSDAVGNSPNNDQFIAEYYTGNTLVSQLGSFSYDAKLGAGIPATMFKLSVYSNIDASNNPFDCRYDYAFETVNDIGFSKHVVYPGIAPLSIEHAGDRIEDCPPVLADMPAGSTIRAFAIRMGDETAADAGLIGYFDNVEFVSNGDATYYNFEPLPKVKEDCQNDKWKTYGFRNQGQCVKSL